jgi:hypothetical protein
MVLAGVFLVGAVLSMLNAELTFATGAHKRPDLIAAIVFFVAFIIILNFFPRLVTFAFFTGDAWGQLPLLTESFRQVHLPWFTLLWTSHVILHLIVLRAGRWRTGCVYG